MVINEIKERTESWTLQHTLSGPTKAKQHLSWFLKLNCGRYQKKKLNFNRVLCYNIINLCPNLLCSQEI